MSVGDKKLFGTNTTRKNNGNVMKFKSCKVFSGDDRTNLKILKLNQSFPDSPCF